MNSPYSNKLTASILHIGQTWKGLSTGRDQILHPSPKILTSEEKATTTTSDIRHCDTLSSFKKRLKTHLFCQCYSWSQIPVLSFFSVYVCVCMPMCVCVCMCCISMHVSQVFCITTGFLFCFVFYRFTLVSSLYWYVWYAVTFFFFFFTVIVKRLEPEARHYKNVLRHYKNVQINQSINQCIKDVQTVRHWKPCSHWWCLAGMGIACNGCGTGSGKAAVSGLSFGGLPLKLALVCPSTYSHGVFHRALTDWLVFCNAAGKASQGSQELLWYLWKTDRVALSCTFSCILMFLYLVCIRAPVWVCVCARIHVCV